MNRLFFLTFIVLCSCGSLEKVDSSMDTQKNSKASPLFNADLKVHYQISNDAKNLHIILNSSDYTIASKILTTGLRICFDVKGKKNDKVYLEYPLVQKQVFSDRILARTRESQRENYSLDNLISQVPNAAIFCSHGVMDRFQVSSTDSDIKVSIKRAKREGIVYDLLIPFTRISKSGFSSLSNLSIGVVTASPNVQNISARLLDASGQSAFGDGDGRDLSAKTPVATSSIRIAPVDRYRNNRPGRPTPSRINDFWFKIHLFEVK